tara:strand:- start:22856 stop:23794 length:939 start_codon:yes stop_codon:yes gene_type:complete
MDPIIRLEQLNHRSAHIDHIPLELFGQGQGTLDLLREDQVFEAIPGNKLRKLIHNISYIIKEGPLALLTFGGAYSNHIAAVAAAGHHFGIKTIGIIRGEELANQSIRNATLSKAQAQGMDLYFVDRATYRQKDTLKNQALWQEKFGPCVIVPEGGTNALAVQGCRDMMATIGQDFDVLAVAVGTGGTLAGMLQGLAPHQIAMGFSALKSYDHTPLIKAFSPMDQCILIGDYHFGGYAKVTLGLIEFINTFKERTGIGLDPIYTGKMMFGLLEMIKKDSQLKNKRIMAVHTGGMQGVDGVNLELARKGWPQIK